VVLKRSDVLSEKVFPVSLGVERYARLKAYSDHSKILVSELIRMAIDDLIPVQEKKEEGEE